MYDRTDLLASRWAPTATDTMIAEAVAYLVSAQSVLDHLTRCSGTPEVSQIDLESAGRALAVALVSLDSVHP